MVDIAQVEAPADLEQAASAFVTWRPRIFGVAYRILGSAADAEDIVQEVWLRWQVTLCYAAYGIAAAVFLKRLRESFSS